MELDDLLAFLDRVNYPSQVLREIVRNEEALQVQCARLHQERDDARREVRRLERELAEVRGTLHEIAACGADDIDPRLRYVVVQIDREDWDRVQKAAERA